jgi:hypothetical protein
MPGKSFFFLILPFPQRHSISVHVYASNALGPWGKLICVLLHACHISSMTPPKLGLECALEEGGE